MTVLTKPCLGYSLDCRAEILDSGIHVLVTGGSRTHVGAVSSCLPGGEPQTMLFPGHRDDAVSAPWARRLADRTGSRATVAAGIHYDGVSRAEIGEILAAADELLGELAASL